jgi:MEKHLA domain
VLHTQSMLDSFKRLLGRDLIDRFGDPIEDSMNLFEASFVVVSHGTQADPVLNYGNRMALELWETDLPTLTSMPSRLTAEPVHRDERAQLMARAARDGFVDDYRGVRISSSGKRFFIEKAIVWNILDGHENYMGQAATFSEWKPL